MNPYRLLHILIFFIFLGPSAKAITADKLQDKLPSDFQGILYNCDPLCNFISIKFENIWNPPLEKIKINIIHPSWVSQSDPLYPLLIQQLPVRPYLPQAKTSAEKKEQRDEKVTPIPPEVPFNYGYSFLLGARVLSSVVSANSTVQEDLNPDSTMQSLSAQLALFRLKPFLLFNNWLQFRLNYDMDFAAASKTAAGNDLEQSATDIHLDTWVMKKGYKLALRLGQLTNSYTTNPNILSSYSFKETWTWFGLGYLYGRYQLTADYGFSVNVTEDQSFRDQIRSAQFFRLGGSWCSPAHEIFDIKYGYCLGLTKKVSKTTSGLHPDFGTSQAVNLGLDETQLLINLRFGDDFYL